MDYLFYHVAKKKYAINSSLYNFSVFLLREGHQYRWIMYMLWTRQRLSKHGTERSK